ncbi:MAG: DUF47 family protein [Pseudomonadota bacterium]
MALWKIFGNKREVDFYQLLLEQSEKTLLGCRALVRYLDNTSDHEELTRLEQEADDIRRILIDELNQTFLTPMDREDIFTLSRAIDDVIDHAYNTAKVMEVFEVTANEFLFRMAELLVKGAEELTNAIRHLKKNPNVAIGYVMRAKRLENEMNDAFLAALNQLFAGNNVRLMLTYREIYRHFNRSADRVDEAANIISDIVVKMG